MSIVKANEKEVMENLWSNLDFDDPQVFHDPKRMSIGSVWVFDVIPKVYCDTSIFYGLVSC